MKTRIKTRESILAWNRCMDPPEILMFTSKLSNTKYSKLGDIPYTQDLIYILEVNIKRDNRLLITECWHSGFADLFPVSAPNYTRDLGQVSSENSCTLCGRNNIMTLVGLHTIYSAEYENKYFPGPKPVCVQFSLCKMDIIILFFPNALSVLFVYKFLDRRTVFCIYLRISNKTEHWHYLDLEIYLWCKQL